MRIAINLATHPFVELRPLFARLRLTMTALAVTAIALGIAMHFLNKNVHDALEQMDSLKQQTLAVQLERQTNEARMRQPQNRAVLERSQFLNDLFTRKSFSWTAVMMDLERVLPAGVQVTSIEPAILAEGGVNIRLRVSGQRDLAVDLVRNLERSQRFLAPRLANETAQSQEHGLTPVANIMATGNVEFEIMSGYNPLPESPKDRERENIVQKAASDQAKPPTPAGAKLPVKPQPVIGHSIAAKPKPAASIHSKKAASVPTNERPVRVGTQ